MPDEEQEGYTFFFLFISLSLSNIFPRRNDGNKGLFYCHLLPHFAKNSDFRAF